MICMSITQRVGAGVGVGAEAGRGAARMLSPTLYEYSIAL